MRSALFIRAVLALAAAFLLGGTVLAAPATTAPAPAARVTSPDLSARAPGCLPRCWTAISFNPETGRGGWTQQNNWGTKQGAMKSAYNHCKARDVNAAHRRACQWPGARDVAVRNGCVAVAKLVRNGRLVQWTIGKADGPLRAKKLAKRKLDGTGTRTAGYSCSPRRF